MQINRKRMEKISIIIICLALLVSSCAPKTVTEENTPTATLTPPAILSSDKAIGTMRTLLQESIDCLAPCFWGITPEQTTLDEAINIFGSIGLQPKYTLTKNDQEFYDTDYHIEKGLEIGIIFAIQDNIVRTLDVGINDTSEIGTPRKWSAYSPEILINQYGIPSKVEFFLGRVTPTPTHSMVLYFENAELIVSYTGSDLLNSGPQLEICPITNHVSHIRIRIGKNPQYPPKQGVPIDEATSLTLESFSKLILGNPHQACFNLKDAAFP